MITDLLGCSTIEQCRQVQKGSLLFKRLRKWIALSSIGVTYAVTYWIDHFQRLALEYINSYDAIVASRTFQWTVAWVATAPPTDWIRDLIHFLRLFDGLKGVVYILVVFYTLRWIYADTVVRDTGRKGFFLELVVVTAVNFILYFILTSRLCFDLFIQRAT
jgi:hypothetical protein